MTALSIFEQSLQVANEDMLDISHDDLIEIIHKYLSELVGLIEYDIHNVSAFLAASPADRGMKIAVFGVAENIAVFGVAENMASTARMLDKFYAFNLYGNTSFLKAKLKKSDGFAFDSFKMCVSLVEAQDIMIHGIKTWTKKNSDKDVRFARETTEYLRMGLYSKAAADADYAASLGANQVIVNAEQRKKKKLANEWGFAESKFA